jgi:hypothetical protein
MEYEGEITVYEKSQLIVKPYFDTLPDGKVLYNPHNFIGLFETNTNGEYLFFPSSRDYVPINILVEAKLDGWHDFIPNSHWLSCFCGLEEKTIAIGFKTGKIEIHNTKGKMTELDAHVFGVDNLIHLPGKRLLSHDGTNIVKIWCFREYKCLAELTHEHHIENCVVQEDEIYVTAKNVIYIWGATSCKLIAKLCNPQRITAFHLCNDIMICGGVDSLTIWYGDIIVFHVKTTCIDYIMLLPNEQILTDGTELRLWNSDLSQSKILNRGREVPITHAIALHDERVGLRFRDNVFGILS